MEGGRSWFSVDSKPFQISIEKVKGRWLERCHKGVEGFHLGPGLARKAFALWLEGAESCYHDNDRKSYRKVWIEGGRDYKLEMRSNRVGRFLLCFVFSMEENRFTLVFL